MRIRLTSRMLDRDKQTWLPEHRHEDSIDQQNVQLNQAHIYRLPEYGHGMVDKQIWLPEHGDHEVDQLNLGQNHYADMVT